MKKLLILFLSVIFSVLSAHAQFIDDVRAPETAKIAKNPIKTIEKLNGKSPKSLNEAVFEKYLSEMQKDIKANWNPPISTESKRIIVLFTVNNDGNLLSKRILQSSNDENADNEALKAIDKTAPFKPFPSTCKDESVDVNFTFDYNEIMR